MFLIIRVSLFLSKSSKQNGIDIIYSRVKSNIALTVTRDALLNIHNFALTTSLKLIVDWTFFFLIF